ncbi:MAG TPA: NADH-quinone oxidoreductase subunit NuoN [Caulobacteraceae bacterium]|nr:NADH-quinone oxidoreductase subunit NuoN [Caulobacteraceae bacterium]
MNLTGALQLALPEEFLAVAAILLLVIGAFRPKNNSGISLGAGFALIVAAALAVVGPNGAAFAGAYIADGIAAYAKVAIYGVSALCVLLGDRWLSRLESAQFEFPILIVLAALGMGMMASAGDLISLYIGIELHSLALYVLAAFRRDDARSSEAGLKYFVLGALSSGLLLYGASLIYGFAGSMRFDVIAQASASGTTTGVLFGLVFLIAGLAFKISAAPFHMWTPDVYEGAPTAIVAFIATAPKMAAMVLLARVLMNGFGGASEQWRQVIVVLAFISVMWGAFAGLRQQNLKRLIAYSSIASIGYALIGLSAADRQGVQSMLVFMVLYMVDVIGFLACLVALQRAGRPMETFADLSGLVRERPGLAVVMTALSFSFLGLPPFSGFWGKFYVFKAALNAGEWPIAVAGLVLSVVAAFYYLRLVKTMWFDPPAGAVDVAPLDAKAVAYAAALFSFPVVLIALAFLDPAATLAAASLGTR